MTHGEVPIGEVAVRSDMLFSWLKSRLTLTSHRLEGKTPNTVFLIPMGEKKVTQPLDRISHVSVDAKPELRRLLIGTIFSLLAYQAFEGGNVVGGIVTGVVAAVAFIQAPSARFVVADASGKEQVVSVSILDRQEVERFAELVNRQVAGVHSSQPAVSPTTPEVLPASGATDRMSQLAQLHRLHQEGALTEAEYENEKRRLLDS